jgi:hypothetical protein
MDGRVRPLDVLTASPPAAPVASAGPSIEADDRPIQAPTSAAAYFDAALRLSAIALLLRPMGSWWVRPAILAVAVLVLIFPRRLRNSLMAVIGVSNAAAYITGAETRG